MPRETRPRKRGSAKASKGLRINMSGVEGKRAMPLEGEYLMRVVEVEQEKGGKSGKPYLAWTFAIEGETGDCAQYNGAKLFYNTSLQSDALWNLRGLLECLGVDIPDGEMDLLLSEYEDMTLLGTVVHEVYDGKKRAKLGDYAAYDPSDDLPDTGDEGVEPEPEVKVVDDETEPQEGDGDLIDPDEVEGMDNNELKQLIADQELGITLKRASMAKKRAQVKDALRDAGLLAE